MDLPHPSYLLLAAFLLFLVVSHGCARPRPGESAIVEPVIQSVLQVKGDEFRGSAVVVDKRGYLLTCAHVIGDTKTLVVCVDGQDVKARTVFMDVALDLAIIKVNVPVPDPLPWSNSSTLRCGDTVYVVGFPLDGERFVGRGIMSGRRANGWLMVDAALNHGQSGGALFDGNGALVGINAALHRVGPDSGNCGIGFCISSIMAHWFVLKYLPE